jgi:uncharacterized protein
MIERTLTKIIEEKSRLFPIVSITGPRQSGKTTLSKLTFPEYNYYNLEAPDTFEKLTNDPRTFLTGKKGIILDEIQKAPELFSFIQVISDEQNVPGQFILSGSQNFLLQNKINQTLAGRVYNASLLPPDLSESISSSAACEDPNKQIFQGFYPRVLSQGIAPADYYPSYIQTYVERDVRDVLHIGNLAQFQRFMKVLAGRAGKLLNLTAIGNEVGIDHKTVSAWLSILEASYLVFFLQPYERNYNKRVVKTPKLYFYDTGLLCSLLGIETPDSVIQHWAKGELFENLIIADIQKRFLHSGRKVQLYFWRDQAGHEVDCIYETNGIPTAIEIKSSATFRQDFLKGLKYFQALPNQNLGRVQLIYAGNDNWIDGKTGCEIQSWFSFK